MKIKKLISFFICFDAVADCLQHVKMKMMMMKVAMRLQYQRLLLRRKADGEVGYLRGGFCKPPLQVFVFSMRSESFYRHF